MGEKMKEKAEQERNQYNRKLVKRTFINEMKHTFVVSLVCGLGILGGYIVAGTEAITYRTGKVSIPPKYKNIEMKYKDILSVKNGNLFVLPTVSIRMKNDEEYKFVVFARKRFLKVLKEMRAK